MRDYTSQDDISTLVSLHNDQNRAENFHFYLHCKKY